MVRQCKLMSETEISATLWSDGHGKEFLIFMFLALINGKTMIEEVAEITLFLPIPSLLPPQVPVLPRLPLSPLFEVPLNPARRV